MFSKLRKTVAAQWCVKNSKTNIDVAKVGDYLERMRSEIKGRREFLNDVAELLVQFIRKPESLLQSYLGFFITGSPGQVKTAIMKQVVRLLSLCGILSENTKESIVNPSAFIGQYIGETAEKTVSLLSNNLDGALLIDEAYMLASCERRDNEDVCTQYSTYSEEAVSSMLSFLSDYRGRIVLAMLVV